jgi:hypothetical protein
LSVSVNPVHAVPAKAGIQPHTHQRQFLAPLIPAQAGTQDNAHRNKPLWILAYAGMSDDRAKCRMELDQNCWMEKSDPEQSQRVSARRWGTEPRRTHPLQTRRILPSHLTKGGLGDVQLKTLGRWPAWPRGVGDVLSL